MYNQLKEQASIRKNIRDVNTCNNLYIKYNKLIDEDLENIIINEMSKGKNSICIFNQKYEKYFDYVFHKQIEKPYTKTIIERLKEKYPAPEFNCVAEYYRIWWDEPLYYRVEIKWNNQCSCILF